MDPHLPANDPLMPGMKRLPADGELWRCRDGSTVLVSPRYVSGPREGKLTLTAFVVQPSATSLQQGQRYGVYDDGHHRFDRTPAPHDLVRFLRRLDEL